MGLVKISRLQILRTIRKQRARATQVIPDKRRALEAKESKREITEPISDHFSEDAETP